MTDTAAICRQLKIKSGTVQRLNKESALYTKEVEEQGRKLDLPANKDEEDWEWRLKNAARLLEESKKMVVDTNARLSKAVGELRDLVVVAREKDLTGNEDLTKAEDILAMVSL